MALRQLSGRAGLADIAAVVSGWPEHHADWFALYVDLGPGRSVLRLHRQLVARLGAAAPGLRTLERASGEEHWPLVARALAAERAETALAEATERIADSADAAVARLVDLLDAETVLISPTGDTYTVADGPLRLRAAESLLDRLGLVKQGRVAVSHSGPGGGPIPVAAVTVSLDLGDKTAGELAAMLQEQVAARS